MKRPYMVAYLNTPDTQLVCGITEKEYDAIEMRITEEYGMGYLYKQPKDERGGRVSFGVTKYGKQRMWEGLNTWVSLNDNLTKYLEDVLGGKEDLTKSQY